MSTSWCYITEQVHTDTGYALQTFTDYWSNRQFFRRKDAGNWKPWNEYATVAATFSSAGGFGTSPKIWQGTLNAYNSIGTKDPNTIYMCY